MSRYFGIPLRNGLPLGLGAVACLGVNATASWTPLTLFAAGEQGGWYDPSDLSTMFQDSAGTTSVTAVEQPVGLWLDKRLGALSALGTELATTPYTGTTTGAWTFGADIRRNGTTTQPASIGSVTGMTSAGTYLFTFTLADFSGDGFTLAANGASLGVGQITGNGVKSFVGTIPASGSPSLQLIPWNGTVGQATITGLSVRRIPGNHLIQPTSASRPTYSKRYNLLLATATLATQSVTVAAGSYTLSFAGAGSITLSGTGSGTYNAGTHTITTTAGSLTLTVSGAVTTADLRRTIHTTMGMPAYQRVTTGTDYDESGFLPRLRFDGADDSMYSAASVNFSASDEMTVLAGVTKLSDAAFGFLVELSASSTTNPGSFGILAPASTGVPDYRYRNRGSNDVTATTATVFPAPRTNVLTGLGDISADVCQLMVNGALAASSSSDQGTGNMGNYVLHVGRRNNTTFPFNGDIFQLIVRGALTSGADLTSAEQYVAARTGVTL